MDRYSYPGEKPQEPVFRSDLEGRPEGPVYQPLRPERSARKVLKRVAAPLLAAGLLFLKFGLKLKGLLFLLLKTKFVGTSLTMILSVAAYAWLFPLWFAVGFVVLIWVHEMGHVLQLKREGIKASAPMFVPFLGAFVAMKQMPKDAVAEARVALAGPILGTLGALGVLGIYDLTEHPLFLGLAYVGFFLNLFNLLPMLPLDGGRAAAALPPVFWILGVLGTVALVFVMPNPILIFIGLLGGVELWHRWKNRHTDEGRKYYDIDPRHRWLVGLAYFGLVAVLAVLMASTFVPDPAAL